MNVALVDTTLVGPVIGGAQTFLVDLAAGLVEQGLAVHVVTAGQPEHRIAAGLSQTGASVHTDLWPSTYLVEDIAAGLASWVHNLNPDVYIVSVSPDIGWAVLPFLQPQIATVAIAHGDSATFFHPMAHYAPYLTWAVGVSETVCERLRTECELPTERVVWIPYGVYPGQDPGLLNAPNADGPLRIIYAGRLTDSQKRASDVIRIVERLRPTALNYQLRVVGDGPLMGDFCRELAPEIAAGRAAMMGWLSREDLHKQLDQSDVFILTSDSEGFPIALVEAMAHGLAPVVTDIPSGNRQLVRHLENGMLAPVGAIDDFVAGIQRLDRDRQLLRSLRAAAWQNGQRFTVQRMIRSYLDCFTNATKAVEASHRMPDPKFPLMGRCQSRYPLWLRRLKLAVGRVRPQTSGIRPQT